MMAMLLLSIKTTTIIRNVRTLRKVTHQGNQTESLKEFLAWNVQPPAEHYFKHLGHHRR